MEYLQEAHSRDHEAHVTHCRVEAEQEKTSRQEQLEERQARHAAELSELELEQLTAMSRAQADHFSKTAEFRVELRSVGEELATARAALAEARARITEVEGSRDELARDGQ